jgi:hypothetical protein
MWFDTIDETLIVGICSLSTELIRFSTLRLPQQQLHNSCYLYLSELLIESFCHMLPSCATLKKVRIVKGLSMIFNGSIAYYLVLF